MSAPVKTIALYDEREVEAFRNAVDAVREERDEDVREGEAVREMSRAYTGWP